MLRIACAVFFVVVFAFEASAIDYVSSYDSSMLCYAWDRKETKRSFGVRGIAFACMNIGGRGSRHPMVGMLLKKKRGGAKCFIHGYYEFNDFDSPDDDCLWLEYCNEYVSTGGQCE